MTSIYSSSVNNDPTSGIRIISDRYSNRPVSISLLRAQQTIKPKSTEKKASTHEVSMLLERVSHGIPFTELSEYISIPKGQYPSDRRDGFNLGNKQSSTGLDIDYKALALPIEIFHGIIDGSTQISSASIEPWRSFVTSNRSSRALDRGLTIN